MNIVCATTRAARWEALRPAFAAGGAELRLLPSSETALACVRDTPPDLLIVDLGLDAAALRVVIMDVLRINAVVHTAAVTDMTADAFHDRMEGLGMLMGLPTEPAAGDIERLLAALRQVSGQ